MEGAKYDKGKTRFDLLDARFLEALAEVMTMGAQKYEENNWQQVDNFVARYTAALHRHLNAYQQGELMDTESNLPHMAHVAANAMFLFWYGGRDLTKPSPKSTEEV